MKSMKLRPAGRADLPLIEARLKHQYDHPDTGLAYPRCEIARDLIAEFKLYGLRWRSGLRIIETADGRPVAAFGFLFSPEARGRGTMIERSNHLMAYGVGPFIFDEEDDVITLGDVVTWMERLAARRFAVIRLCIVTGDWRLGGLLDARGWTAKQENLEMKWAAQVHAPAMQPAIWLVESLIKADDPNFLQVCRLFAETFHWQDESTTRLRDYLDEGYRIGLVLKEGVVMGASIWLKVEDTEFGRLEYLAVIPSARRRQIGSALIRAALEDMRKEGCLEVFLSVEPSATALRDLYTAMGFVPTIQSTVYELSFG
jgi:GNAT superfamily N-acetyltransferase